MLYVPRMQDDPKGTKRVHLPPGDGEIRHAVIGLANLLCGGADGATQTNSESDLFDFVTQGRQTSWKDSDGTRHTYSACEDLPQAVLTEICGFNREIQGQSDAEAYRWVNRAPEWKPGWNLISLKQYAGFAWHDKSEVRPFEANVTMGIGPKPGDVVQVQGSTGPHTLILLSDYGIEGWATADYGQFFNGAHGGRVYERLPVELGYYGRPSVWSKGQGVFRPIIGWLDSAELVKAMPNRGRSLVARNYVPVT